MKLSVCCCYGPLQRNQEYKVLREGLDYYVMSCGGTIINVPKNLIGKSIVKVVEEEEDEEWFDTFYSDKGYF